ncbi:MAG: hypothetical protein ACXVCY_12515 [Pseudobdellovibrionaceae bacterium]
MKCLFLFTLTFIFLTGCSIYRSEGRKQFESDAPGKISTAALYQLKECKKSNSLENWINEEFPNKNYELITAENELEIWRSSEAPTVEITAIQKNDSTIQTCIYEFADATVWNANKNQFIHELKNNLMTLE